MTDDCYGDIYYNSDKLLVIIVKWSMTGSYHGDTYNIPFHRLR